MNMNLEISLSSAFYGFYKRLPSPLPIESGSLQKLDPPPCSLILRQKVGGLTTHITMVFLLPGFDQL